MKYLKNIYSMLQNTNISIWKYCMRVFLIAVIPSFLAVLLITLTLDVLGIEKEPIKKIIPSFRVFFDFVIFAPIFETFILVIFIFILNSIIKLNLYISIITGLVFGLLHGFISVPIHFFGTAWTFFALSAAFLSWKKYSLFKAYFAALLPHSLVNLSSLILVFFTDSF